MLSRRFILTTLGLLLTIAPLATNAAADPAKPTNTAHPQRAHAASLAAAPNHGLITTTWCRTPDDILKCTPFYTRYSLTPISEK
jgi:hypothetical protein